MTFFNEPIFYVYFCEWQVFFQVDEFLERKSWIRCKGSVKCYNYNRHTWSKKFIESAIQDSCKNFATIPCDVTILGDKNYVIELAFVSLDFLFTVWILRATCELE